MRLFIVFPFCFIIIFCAIAGPADSKMTVYSPEEMIKKAPDILVGRVKGQSPSKGGSRTTVSIEKVIKGNVPEKEITIIQPQVPKFGLAGLPQPETRVMVFLQKSKEERYTLFAELNNVGIVDENNTVKLYKGAGSINQKTARDYELVYTTFLFQTYDAEKKLIASKNKKDNSMLLGGLLVAVAAIAFAVYILKRRKIT